MEIKQGYAYHIKDEYFIMAEDEHLMKNKEDGNYRPTMYCIKDNKYDIVFGEIADGTIANVANRIKNNDLNINEVDYSLFIPESGRYYESQYSFHSLKSLTCIKSISCAIIKPYNKRKRRR